MRGAIIFLSVFFATLVATLAYPAMPPGPQFYALLGVPPSDYPALGIPVTTLVVAVFNGMFYGIIAWLAYTAARRAGVVK